MSKKSDHKNEFESSRRNFIKTSAAALSTAAVSAADLSRRVYAAGSDVIKIGLIGCGGRGSGAALDAMQVNDDVRLIAMTDVFEDRLHDKRKMLMEAMPNQTAVDADHCFVGFDGYKKVIESDVDAVLIACASLFHPRYMKAAIDAGKHVFVEKPHGIDPQGVRMVKDVCESAKKKNLCIVSGLMNRYIPAVQETMKRIHDGAIGDIAAIEENFLRAPYVLVPPKAW